MVKDILAILQHYLFEINNKFIHKTDFFFLSILLLININLNLDNNMSNLYLLKN
jgi:hypothetical protein